MLSTTYFEPVINLIAPAYQVSLGPRYIRQKSLFPEESYGYLWVMTINPQNRAFTFHQLRTSQGQPYNWYRRSDVLAPGNFSLANLVSLQVPDSQLIKWASFAFDPNGELNLAIYYATGTDHTIKILDSSGSEIVEIQNAKYPFLVPDFLLTRESIEGGVNVFFLTVSDNEVRYYDMKTGETGTVATVPPPLRGGLFLADYAYFPGALELVYSTPSRFFFFVRVAPEHTTATDQSLLKNDTQFRMNRVALRAVGRTVHLGKHDLHHILSSFITSLSERFRPDTSLNLDRIPLYFLAENVSDNLGGSGSLGVRLDRTTLPNEDFLLGGFGLEGRYGESTYVRETEETLSGGFGSQYEYLATSHGSDLEDDADLVAGVGFVYDNVSYRREIDEERLFLGFEDRFVYDRVSFRREQEEDRLGASPDLSQMRYERTSYATEPEDQAIAQTSLSFRYNQTRSG